MSSFVLVTNTDRGLAQNEGEHEKVVRAFAIVFFVSMKFMLVNTKMILIKRYTNRKGLFALSIIVFLITLSSTSN